MFVFTEFDFEVPVQQCWPDIFSSDNSVKQPVFMIYNLFDSAILYKNKIRGVNDTLNQLYK